MMLSAYPDTTEGASSSTKVTFWTMVDALPHSSIAVKVRTTVYSWGQSPAMTSSDTLTTTSEQLSVAPGSSSERESVQSRTMSSNCSITGASLSLTLMVCVAVLSLPQSSTAVNVRIMVYWPSHSPSITSVSMVMVASPQSSVAVATPKAALALAMSSQDMSKVPGTFNTGGVMSDTSMICSRVRV